MVICLKTPIKTNFTSECHIDLGVPNLNETFKRYNDTTATITANDTIKTHVQYLRSFLDNVSQ